ncbi:DUF3052 domain-containing protein [Streptomyces sp. NPDC059761]|uniref:DUF3052 domain-containing protein n=1 Tax=Streptomyces sp. NPDC059761 TaxID=3346937 RepID=UPI0036581DCA
MSTTQGEHTNLAIRLGFESGQVVQEIGAGDDADQELREAIAELTGQDLVDEDYDGVADAGTLWFREDDGDLVDAIALLERGGVTWLLAPKSGRDGYIEPSDIAEAAVTAGLSQTGSTSVAKDWTGTRLIAPTR